MTSELFHPIKEKHSFFEKQYIGQEGNEFYSWHKIGFYCFLFGFNKRMIKRCFQKQIEINKSNNKETKTWHIRAFLYGLRGIWNGFELPLIKKEEWPDKPDKSWEDIVCFYPDGSFEFDFLHPISCVFWNDNNPKINNPFENNNITLDYNLLVELGFDVMYMNMLEAVVSEEQNKSHLKTVN